MISEFVRSFLDFHTNMKSEKVLQAKDEETIMQFRGKGVPKKGRPIQEIVDEMKQTVYANQIYVQHPR